MKKLIVIVAVVMAVIAIAVYSYQRAPSLGVNPGPTSYTPQEFMAGVTYGNYLATSTSATTYTLVAADLVGSSGFAYDTIALTPTVGDLTITLPASSTLRHFLPQAGMSAKQCFYNASTTAGIDITIAAGTGIDLEVASSTTAGGETPALTILADSTGCLDYIRKPATATAFDITVLFSRFVNGD